MLFGCSFSREQRQARGDPYIRTRSVVIPPPNDGLRLAGVLHPLGGAGSASPPLGTGSAFRRKRMIRMFDQNLMNSGRKAWMVDRPAS